MSSDSPASIIFDESGNPVSILFDGVSYRLAVETTLTDGYDLLGTATNPLRVDPVGQTVQPVMGMLIAQGNAPVGNPFKGYPIVISGVDDNGLIQLISVDGYGVIFVRENPSTSTVFASISASTSSTNLLTANLDRTGATVFNDSTSPLYLLCGFGASLSRFTNVLAPAAIYNLPFNYTGNVDGYWTSSSGFARITSFFIGSGT